MSRPLVVVVSRPGAAADSLREALEQAGATLAWIGEPEQLEVERPTGEVVVVNLDPAIEGDLSRLDSLWASGTVRVVFNDATVTEGLSGWDLTRWARHLVAKVFALGGHPELPERPPDAEAIPVAAEGESPAEAEEVAPVLLRIPGRRYVEDEISEEMGAPPLPYDAVEPVMSASAPGGASLRPDRESPKVEAPPTAISPTLASAEPTGAEGPAADMAAIGEEDQSLKAIEEGELPFTDDLDLIVGEGSAEGGLPPISIDVDAELEVPAPSQEDELEKLLRQAGAPSEAQSAKVSGAAGRGSATRPVELKLADQDSPSPVASETAKGAAASKVDWTRFRLDKLSLVPLEQDGSKAADGPAEAPSAPEKAAPTPARTGPAAGAASGVASSARPAQQLWLLVGSFGAPEAMAQFLGQLRTSQRAALLIAESGGDGAAALASMLAKRTGRSIPVLGQQSVALAAGDMWVVPEGLCLGSSTRQELRWQRGNAASWLDTLIREAVNLFASDCGVIVFSGASREGFDGTLAVAQRGGAVWVQDPATAISPELPEMVRSRGVALFVGTPRVLAEHFNQEVG
ncbi:MAG: hypothetical protein KatS3mg125_1854 [Lysobacterales bacterium]|jgi:two-component system chemotaxis response regulator CheB/chemosensory pili system protein ChpB (putative protein-glutamate methylesterase)|nr:MAG: hypothetical protein KatS3mg125_1854 [Xanthomonadales bacterium]